MKGIITKEEKELCKKMQNDKFMWNDISNKLSGTYLISEEEFNKINKNIKISNTFY